MGAAVPNSPTLRAVVDEVGNVVRQAIDGTILRASDDIVLFERAVAEEPGFVAELLASVGAGAERTPAWLERLRAGNAFNEARKSAYPYNEVYIQKADGSCCWRLDSYNPATEEIVSRKFTQLASIKETTAKAYIDEIARKYPVGADIARVPTSGTLAGTRLEGSYYLEVPVQKSPIPRSLIDYALKNDVKIRDPNGVIYK